ncbi:MAG TPA: hypothetical protein VJ501_03480 [Burkholderiaceae bacterium]|nr:hypothetical protein [Burkholderiaceae bacterium]
MNPALCLVLVLLGSVMMVAGVLAAVLGWLPIVPAVALAVGGAAIETPAALAFARSRRRVASPQPRR